jgi:hypothetical protein
LALAVLAGSARSQCSMSSTRRRMAITCSRRITTGCWIENGCSVSDCRIYRKQRSFMIIIGVFWRERMIAISLTLCLHKCMGIRSVFRCTHFWKSWLESISHLGVPHHLSTPVTILSSLSKRPKSKRSSKALLLPLFYDDAALTLRCWVSSYTAEGVCKTETCLLFSRDRLISRRHLLCLSFKI